MNGEDDGAGPAALGARDSAPAPVPAPREQEREWAREDRQDRHARAGRDHDGAAARGAEGHERDREADREDGRDDDRQDPHAQGPTDGAEWRFRQEERFREATRGPLDDEGGPGEARAAARAQRAAQARFDIRGNSSVFDRSRFGHAHFGDVYVGSRDTAAPVFGTVPEDELDRLRQVYRPPVGYPDLKESLRARHVVVLGGPPGTGRLTTGLCLLDELTAATGEQLSAAGAGDGSGSDTAAARGRVTRLAPSDLGLISGDPDSLAEGVPAGGGFIVELPETPGDWTAPQELHLDALAARLAARHAFAVLVVSPSSPGGHLLTGRYGRACPPAPAEELLAWQLMRHLADEPDADALSRGEQILAHPLLRSALGIRPQALRPSETEYLAALVARHVRGGMSRAELLDACAEVARRQAREWFAGTAGPAPAAEPIRDRDRGGAAGGERADDDRAQVREAAFRIALAVLDGEAFSAVADAAELLAQEIFTARAPERRHGRPVFAENLEGLLAACRARLHEGEEESVGGVPVPVRTVAYCGEALAGAVLAEVWHRHHAARAPVVRWLRALAGDARPQVWVRAAVVAGELATADLGYGFTELIRPPAVAGDLRRRFFAATALGQAAGREPYRSAVRAVVADWAQAPVAALRWTAALTLGFGRVVDDTRTALEQLCAIGSRDDGAQSLVASYGVARLAAGSRAGETATVLREWAEEASGERLHLALLSAVRLFSARTDEMWQPEGPDDHPPADGTPPETTASAVRLTAGVSGRLPAVPRAEGGRRRADPRGGAGGLVPALRPPVPRASTARTDAELARRIHWPLALAVAVSVESAAEPLADLLWRALDSHLSAEAATEGLCLWLRAAEADAALPGHAGGARAYVFERDGESGEKPRPTTAGDGTTTPPGEILRALLWLLPRMIRDRRDAARVRWLLRTLCAAPEEPMTEAFERHVLASMAATRSGPMGRGEERR
ncbi:hypothetical protein [Streptomyces sp. NBC_00582]|uniref:hypothetical protein n=1 Tax=Streptomyces sp. NBC_00582 TaxID=2975783 RepID=UPI0010644100|nr:hypothetical protein [Streptomyces sp. NBC_00582]WUB60497.1 hypothetical protein OG852_08895 [Streptomyces sp. NBC_00582]